MKRCGVALALLLTLGASCASAAAPTLISYAETASWVTTGSPKTVASVTWQTGDVVVVLQGSENNAVALGVPTVAGLTFTSQKATTFGSGTICGAQISAAVAASASSGTISATGPPSSHWGFGVWVWRGSAGIGNSAISTPTASAKTVALTASAADGGMVWGIFDFNADGALAGTPTPTNTRQTFDDGAAYSAGVFDLGDQASAGSVSYGGTGGGTTGGFAIVVLEVKAGAGGATCTPTLSLMGVGRCGD